MAPRGLLEKPIADTEEALSGETRRALLFGLVAALVIVLMVLVGVSGETAATHVAQLNVETLLTQAQQKALADDLRPA